MFNFFFFSSAISRLQKSMKKVRVKRARKIYANMFVHPMMHRKLIIYRNQIISRSNATIWILIDWKVYSFLYKLSTLNFQFLSHCVTYYFMCMWRKEFWIFLRCSLFSFFSSPHSPHHSLFTSSPTHRRLTVSFSINILLQFLL